MLYKDMQDTAYIEALKHYQELVHEHTRAKEAYSIDSSKDNYRKLQESIIALKRQDDVINMHRYLDRS